MNKNLRRRYQLNADTLETLDDVKKILNLMQIRIETDHESYEELKEFFPIEVVPRGYFKLLETVGHEEIAKMTLEEIEEEATKLL